MHKWVVVTTLALSWIFNKLKILNADENKGISSYESKISNSIIDHVIVNGDWKFDIIDIKMNVINYKFFLQTDSYNPTFKG